MSLYSTHPDPDELLSLPPAELGQLILDVYFVGNRTYSRNNLNIDLVAPYPKGAHERISRAILEAFSWLVREGLIAEGDQTGWFFVTKLGDQFRGRSNVAQASSSAIPIDSDHNGSDTEKNDLNVNDVDSSHDGEELSVRVETIFKSGLSDQPARTDSLGFLPYVTAIADFLTDDNTEPPLTLSIEGEWGSGKSSFMLQLKEMLGSRGHLTVSFDAWRHDKADELWATFALELIRQISHEQPFWRRWWANISLRRRRYDFAAGWLDILRTVATLVFLSVTGLAVPVLLLIKGWGWADEIAKSIVDAMGEKGDIWAGVVNWVLKIGGGSAIVLIAATLWLKLKSHIGNPIAGDLKKHLKSPNYEERVAFVEHFHRDLDRIVSSFVGDRRVYIFIDDLDRCEVPKASDLMQAINLMIDNDPNLFFIVGIDREKIAAGLAIKYEKLLTYIDARHAALFENQPSRDGNNPPVNQNRGGPWIGLEFGYKFIEKFIQVPFRIPTPSNSDFERLLDTLKPHKQLKPGLMTRVSKAIRDKLPRKRNQSKPRVGDITSAQIPDGENRTESSPSGIQVLNLISGENETETTRRITQMVASILGYNPRRVKQFLNLFRLKVHICYQTGLFDAVGGNESERTLTLEQVGKFVALTQMYPRLLFDLDFDRRLLKKLDRRSRNLELANESDITDAVQRWERCREVMDLVSYGLERVTTPDTAKYSLGEFNVDKLLQVSPFVPRQLTSVDSALLHRGRAGQLEVSSSAVNQANNRVGVSATDAAGRFSLIEPVELLKQVKNELLERGEVALATVLDGVATAYLKGDELYIAFGKEQDGSDSINNSETRELLQDLIAGKIGRNLSIRSDLSGASEKIDNLSLGPSAQNSDFLDPELELLHFQFADVTKADSGRFVRVHSSSVEKAAAIDFDFKPVRDSVPWVEVRAQILIKYDQNQVTHVIDGIWHDRDAVEIPFRPGEPRTLFIASYSTERGFFTYEYTGRTSIPLQKPLGKNPVRVQVRLIGRYMDNPRLQQLWYFKLSQGEGQGPLVEVISRQDFEE